MIFQTLLLHPVISSKVIISLFCARNYDSSYYGGLECVYCHLRVHKRCEDLCLFYCRGSRYDKHSKVFPTFESELSIVSVCGTHKWRKMIFDSSKHNLTCSHCGQKGHSIPSAEGWVCYDPSSFDGGCMLVVHNKCKPFVAPACGYYPVRSQGRVYLEISRYYKPKNTEITEKHFDFKLKGSRHLNINSSTEYHAYIEASLGKAGSSLSPAKSLENIHKSKCLPVSRDSKPEWNFSM